MSEWQPIKTAPKRIVRREVYSELLTHEYGERILAWPVYGEVAIIHWYQAKWTVKDRDNVGGWNTDGNGSAHPTYWKPLDEPPET